MYQATLTAGQTSAPQAAGIGSVARLTISSGSGYVEYTTGSFADIGNNVATWTTWPKGTVGGTAQDTAGFPMIVRFTCVTGTVAVMLADPSDAEFPSNALIPWESMQPSYAFDSFGNVTGLVGPGDGTVHPWLLDTTPAAQQCFRTGASVVGWTLTNTGGATATMAMDLASPLGGPALKVTFPNDTGTVDLDATGIEVSNFTAGRGKVVVHAYVQDELGIKQIRVYAGTSSLTRNMDRTYNLSNSNVFRANGDHIIPLHPDNATANTLLTTDTLDTVRLRMNAQSGGGAVWIGGIYIPDPEPEPWMVVTFDDADASLYSRLYPYMAGKGLKWTLGVNWDDVGTNDSLYVNFTQLAAMYAAGVDIASHNRTNTAYPDENPPTAQPNDAARLTYCTEYRYCRGRLLNLGYTRASGYHPFVQGAFDGALCDAMHAHGGRLFRSASTETNVEPFMLNKQIVVSQRKLGSANSLATARTWVDQALTRSQDVLLMGHVLAATASSTITWAQTDYEALIEYALAQGLRVGSVSQWAQARGIVV